MVAQDAAPADRNAVNTRARPGDMMADSPVTFKKALKALAAEERCAYLDLTTPWAEYIRSSKLHPHVFYRDVVHANEYGEQILAKILMASIGSTRPLPEHRAP
jgi:lysophospholipase L1-like esterase